MRFEKSILTNKEFILNPQSFYKKWREKDGVYYDEALKSKLVVSGEIGKFILQNNKIFPTHIGTIKKQEEGLGKAMNNWLLFFDTSKHLEFRKYVEPFFRKSGFNDLKQKIKLICESVLDEISSEFDLFSDLAMEVSTRTVIELFGWRNVNVKQLKSLAKAGAYITYLPKQNSDHEKLKFVIKSFDNLLKKCIDQNEYSKDGLIAHFLKAKEFNFSDDEITDNLLLFFLAAIDPSASGIVNSAYLMANNPDLYGKFVSNEAERGFYIDELLRVFSPLQYVARQANENCTIGNYQFEKGDDVLLMIEAMNTDPDIYDNPINLNLDRTRSRHFTFGGGMYFCLGYYLAKIEIELVLMALSNDSRSIIFSEKLEKPKRFGVNTFIKGQVKFV